LLEGSKILLGRDKMEPQPFYPGSLVQIRPGWEPNCARVSPLATARAYQAMMQSGPSAQRELLIVATVLWVLERTHGARFSPLL